MYSGTQAKIRPQQPAFIMARSGEAVSYAELERRSNRLAHLLRAEGLLRLDHYSIFMENNARYLECCDAGERAGSLLHLHQLLPAWPTSSPTSSHNSQSKVLITSMAKRRWRGRRGAIAAIVRCLVVDGPGDGGRIRQSRRGDGRLARYADRRRMPRHGDALFVRHHRAAEGHPAAAAETAAGAAACRCSISSRGCGAIAKGMIYLSPAPLYHSAPQAAVNLTIRVGGTAVIMEHFDPEAVPGADRAPRVTHSQLVPTMFSRMLKLPEEARRRYDLSSLEIAIHAAAPCPIPVKEQMIEWWGPIIQEYYGATEGPRLHRLRHAPSGSPTRGTVGKRGARRRCTSSTRRCTRCRPARRARSGSRPRRPFEYFHDAEKTREARSADGSMSTVGDVGYLDADGYLYLTDRRTFMIISGGVNIYPQECENLLITHPKVADAAVFGVPNEDLGEEVKAVVQPMPGVAAGPELAEAELIGFCREHLAHHEVPALGRLRRRTAAPAHRQALQAPAARRLLGQAQHAGSSEAGDDRY